MRRRAIAAFWIGSVGRRPVGSAAQGSSALAGPATYQMVTPPSAGRPEGRESTPRDPACGRVGPAPASASSAPSVCSAIRARCCTSAASGCMRAIDPPQRSSDRRAPPKVTITAIAISSSTRLNPAGRPRHDPGRLGDSRRTWTSAGRARQHAYHDRDRRASVARQRRDDQRRTQNTPPASTMTSANPSARGPARPGGEGTRRPRPPPPRARRPSARRQRTSRAAALAKPVAIASANSCACPSAIATSKPVAI